MPDPTSHNDCMRALWAQCEADPVRVADLTQTTLRSLLVQREGADYSLQMTDEQMRGAVLRMALGDSPLPHYAALWEAIDECDSALILRDLEPLTVEQILCLLDPAREDESVCMIDDLEERVGLPEDEAGALRAWVTDRHNVLNRG